MAGTDARAIEDGCPAANKVTTNLSTLSAESFLSRQFQKSISEYKCPKQAI